MDLPFIDAEAVRRHLDDASLVDALEAAHRQPPPAAERLLLEQPGADGHSDAFLIWPAWQPGEALGIKLVTSFPANPERGEGLPTIQALYLLFDGENGRPLALIDGTELTFWKTAADSALGARFLARRDARRLLMIGAGALAPALIRAHLAVRPGIEVVRIWNRTPEKAAAIASEVSGVDAAVAPDLEAESRLADVISAATGATEPLIRGAWLKPGAHVDLVGGFSPKMREADDDVVRRAEIYVDSRWFTVGQAGDLTQPIAAGVIGPDDVRGDLFDLATGRVPGRTRSDAITLFKNGGGAHLDLMTACHLMARIRAAQG